MSNTDWATNERIILSIKFGERLIMRDMFNVKYNMYNIAANVAYSFYQNFLKRIILARAKFFFLNCLIYIQHRKVDIN